MPGAIIRTARLLLRPPRPADAPDIFTGYATDPEVTRYLTWRPHQSVEETRAFITRCIEGWQSGRELTWGLTLPPDDRVIGMIGFRPAGRKADLGYVLGRSHWNRGYMTEAGRAVIAAGFEDPALVRIWATCDVGNAASARVLEKLGMRREGVLRAWIVHPNLSDDPADSCVYAILRPGWPG